MWNEISCTKLQLPPEPLTRELPPPDPHSLCPLSSNEFVEPPSPEKNSWVCHWHPCIYIYMYIYMYIYIYVYIYIYSHVTSCRKNEFFCKECSSVFHWPNKANSHKSLTFLIAYQVFVVILVQTKTKRAYSRKWFKKNTAYIWSR
jgi:hypothetical protein